MLLDKSAEFGDRDDAAMDLGAFNECKAEDALIQIVLDYSEDKDIADSAGESISEIWKRKGKFDFMIVDKMHPEAKKHFKNKNI